MGRSEKYPTDSHGEADGRGSEVLGEQESLHAVTARPVALQLAEVDAAEEE
jgi:hypothetical protein